MKITRKQWILLFLLTAGFSGLFSGMLSHVIYDHEQHQLFLFCKGYFYSHLGLPGGLLKYITAFVVQFFYHPLLGSVLLASCIALVYPLGAIAGARISGKPDTLQLSLLAPLFLMIQYAAIEFPVSVVIGVLLNQLFVILLLRLPRKVCYFALFPFVSALYFLTGGYCLIFISMAMTNALSHAGRQTKRQIPLFAAFSIGLPFLGSYVCAVPVHTAITAALPDAISAGVLLLLLLLLSHPVLAYLFQERLTQSLTRLHRGFSSAGEAERVRSKRTVIVSVFFPLCYLLSASGFLMNNFDSRVRILLQASQYAKQNNWQGVLQSAGQYDGKNHLATYLTNLALFHTGRMPGQMFSFRQDWGKESLFFPWTGNSRESEYGDLVYAGLGYLNEAHHWTFEAMTVFGQTAPILQKLIAYNIANERPAVARRFINVLRQSLFYRSWADRADKIIRDSRSLPYHRVSDDTAHPARFSNFTDIGPDLLYLCRREPGNRMAFEYLMSYYLLTNQVVKFAENLWRKDAFSYPKLPRAYDEALLTYQLGVSPDVFRQLRIDVQPETMERLKQYYAMLRGKSDRRQLKEKFGDTYWYYLHFESPYGNKIIDRP
ncbi:MAG: DUF6057 family protein [Bacteroidales bacterium]|jgi:hypothetical protein|nr:DUF6057 family protein [Bacteroidales bacterium]